jgi:hypothetical protein
MLVRLVVVAVADPRVAKRTAIQKLHNVDEKNVTEVRARRCRFRCETCGRSFHRIVKRVLVPAPADLGMGATRCT